MLPHAGPLRAAAFYALAALAALAAGGGAIHLASQPGTAAARSIGVPAAAGPRLWFGSSHASPRAGEVSPIRSVLNTTGRMGYGEFLWNDAGVPAGPGWVRIDLARQTLSVFRGGHEIGTAVILYGEDDKPTPTGRLTVLAKDRDHRSSAYDAAMPFTLRLTADGVAIHGSDVRYGAATHGCIGVPTAFAGKLFDAVAIGDPVLILPARRS